MPFIAAKLGFTMAIATILLAITQICSNMLQPVFGFFADNMLKRFFVFWGLILTSTFIPLATTASNIWILTIFMILGCLGSSFFHPQSMGFIKIFSEKDLTKNMGIFVSLGSLGFAFGPLIAAYITQYTSIDKISYTSFFGIVLACLMFVCIPKLSNTDKEIQHKNFFKSFKEIASNNQIKYLMLISMMKTLVTNSSCILLPFLWKNLGYTPFYIGFALFLFVFAGAIGSFASPKLEKTLGSKPILYASMWGTLPLMICFGLTYKTMPIISLLIFSLIGFVTMLAQPVTLVWAQKTLPEYKSVVAGLINGFCWGTIAFCLTFLGFFAEKFGIINVLILLTIFPILSSHYINKLEEV
jgi:FSR family fosmidomycin resistance protein-like MFS transporter